MKNYVCPIFISIQGFVTMRKSFGLVTSFFRSLFSTSMSMVDLSVQKLFPLGWVFETASCSLKHLMMQNCESAVALRKMFASYSFTISFKRCLILKVLNWENRFCQFCYYNTQCIEKISKFFLLFSPKTFPPQFSTLRKYMIPKPFKSFVYKILLHMYV